MSEPSYESLIDPESLWPDPADEQTEDSPQHSWVWAAMAPGERRVRLRELARWVEWLGASFELQDQIPQCWYRHPAVVEHLTALYAAWVRVYGRAPVSRSGRYLAEAEWISTLYAFVPRLHVAGCAGGGHHEPPARNASTRAEEAFEAFLTDAPFVSAEPIHPAAEEAARQGAAGSLL